MITFIIISLLILTGFILKKASKKLGWFASEIEKIERDRARYKEELLGSIKNIEKELSPSVTYDRIDTKAIIEDQQRLSEKANLQKAIEEELGI